MWLQTTFGFFSIVQKPGEAGLTVRGRARGDLEQLRERYLGDLGEIRQGEGTDYRYRASASHAAVAEAVQRMVLDIDYGNFKSEVERRAGHERAEVYSKVWKALLTIQREEER
ncbi:MAG: hypothetical protein ACODAG_04385 [Myxococcota bacterium]